MEAEGWYKDPFGRHEDRWFSDGRPTHLVRDGRVDGEDPPPSESYDGRLEPALERAAAHGSDLRRADAAEAEEVEAPDLLRAGGPQEPESGYQAVLDVFGELGGTD